MYKHMLANVTDEKVKAEYPNIKALSNDQLRAKTKEIQQYVHIKSFLISHALTSMIVILLLV